MPKVDSSHLEYKRIGSGGANVVFLNGFRMNFESWDKVYPEVATNHNVLLFNRRGVGSSPKATVVQTGHGIVEEIRALLSRLALDPPYLFVGHSLGGIFANLYARLYPDEVLGVVFVDAPHPLEIAEQKKHKPPLIVRTLNEGVKAIEKLFDKFKYSEDECIEQSVFQIQNAASFPNVPVAVVSGTKKMPFVPETAFEVHQHYQTKLLDLSSHSKRYLCENSGHFPQITEPDKVALAILATLSDALRSH
ncbi:MAG: alpha/beta hydrolase [Chromatiales bacterium]|nr:alpha/beta hydrolase [Chromatiales bacterium]